MFLTLIACQRHSPPGTSSYRMPHSTKSYRHGAMPDGSVENKHVYVHSLYAAWHPRVAETA